MIDIIMEDMEIKQSTAHPRRCSVLMGIRDFKLIRRTLHLLRTLYDIHLRIQHIDPPSRNPVSAKTENSHILQDKGKVHYLRNFISDF